MLTENTVKLVTQADMGKALHVALHINSEKDAGMLYLKEDEYKVLIKLLESGATGCVDISVVIDNSAIDPVYDEYEYDY